MLPLCRPDQTWNNYRIITSGEPEETIEIFNRYVSTSNKSKVWALSESQAHEIANLVKKTQDERLIGYLNLNYESTRELFDCKSWT